MWEEGQEGRGMGGVEGAAVGQQLLLEGAACMHTHACMLRVNFWPLLHTRPHTLSHTVHTRPTHRFDDTELAYVLTHVKEVHDLRQVLSLAYCPTSFNTLPHTVHTPHTHAQVRGRC